MNLRKIPALVLTACAALVALSGCAPASTSGGTGTGSPWSSLLMIGMVVVVFYFFAIRPESKRKKKAQEMRDSIEVGDSIVTISGLLGKVVHVTDDKITFETGEDRVRLEAFKWTVSEVKGKGDSKDKGDSAESADKS